MSGDRGAYHPGGHPASEGESSPVLGEAPPLTSLWPSALARLLLVVWLGGWSARGGGEGCSLCPEEPGVEIKSSVTSQLMGRGITKR